nr:hypothetical protein [Tanacetum cinerariifolium]
DEPVGSGFQYNETLEGYHLKVNGNVSVFDMSSDQAEQIMKIADNGSSGLKFACEPAVVVKAEINQSSSDNKDLPMLRKKSIGNFLEKRKEKSVLLNLLFFKLEGRPHSCRLTDKI